MLIIIQLTALLTLLGTNLIEMFWHISTCELCAYQRIIWFVILGISLTLKNYPKLLVNLILGLLSLAMLIAMYQLLLQYNILNNTQSCNIMLLSFEESLATTIPNCGIIEFNILSIPLSFYNLLVSLVILIYILIYGRKNV